ncbi:MAG: DUF1311 domain-containing protein [Mitsuaria chitosanitabida]|uniref:lysozyme inhibitor LprI family protein n=1 Tax=Roseateles chitosanitabidus TaxID=65048 RepID=UPI001B14984E|nr:lysozyme inhibitor LprI family protein [Roseateles chitosanitabidus]MBO9689154.1 DUF1311 domain-containing protein [Roseateles chitosanitabidus]
MPRFLMSVVLLTMSAWTHHALAASFDCARAGSSVERMICTDPTLSDLDDLLSAVYRSHERDSDEDGSPVVERAILEAQKRWLAARNACGDSDCLEKRYEERIGALAPCPTGRRGTDELCIAMVEQAERALQREEQRSSAQLAKSFATYTNAEDYVAAAQDALRETQAAWRAFRNAECAYEPLRAGMSFGYSADVTVLCKLEMTRKRRALLKAATPKDD